jgi:hypothetical protein
VVDAKIIARVKIVAAPLIACIIVVLEKVHRSAKRK